MLFVQEAMQKQLRRFQEDLMGWKDDQTFEDGRRNPPVPAAVENGNGYVPDAKIKALETELQLAKESERHMLEYLTSQTKQLEQTKIQLEEAKLEIRGFQDMGCTREEIARLRNEVDLAVQAEEKSKKAMDGLAAALKEVATEAKVAKEKLKVMETQYLSARAEADHTMSMLKASDERIRSAMEEARQAKAEAGEVAEKCRAKEDGLAELMRSFEIEITRLKESNDELRAAHRSSREDLSKMRDIMKQAVNEATVVKEALEIARAENSRLQDSAVEREQALQKAKQELQCIKVSEAAALASLEELKNLLAATSNMEFATSNIEFATVEEPPEAEEPRIGGRCRPYGSFRLPPVDPRSFGEVTKHRRFSSMGTMSMPMPETDGEEMLSAWGSPARQRKKKPMLKKFGDMLKRSFRK